jgi:hypothetical protein
MLGELVRGFVAAAISVLAIHQVIVGLANKLGLWPGQPYSTAPIGPLGVPTIVNSIFWGGLWGVVYALFNQHLPDGPLWLRGMMFGWLMVVFSNCLLVPFLKGQPLFFGFDPKKLMSVTLILSGFGAALALLYDWLGGII